MAKVIVSRLEPYPAEEPTSYAVGFTVTCSNDRSFYIDTTVTFEEAQTDEEAVQVALDKLRDDINSKVQTIEAKSTLLGREIELD